MCIVEEQQCEKCVKTKEKGNQVEEKRNFQQVDGFTVFDCKLTIKGREEIVWMMAKILLRHLVAVDSIN